MTAETEGKRAPAGRKKALLGGTLLLAIIVAAIAYVMTAGRGGGGLLIYVGSSMRQPMQECAARYERQTGVHISPSYADSGEVLAQVRNTGQGDLAILHEPYLTQGVRDGWASRSVVVAHMTPVIAVAKGNPRHVAGLKDFLRPEVRIGLTDARYATSGMIARDALGRAGILDQVMARHPYENKSSGQLAIQVLTGTLDAVIIWDAVAAQQPDRLDIVPIDAEIVPPSFTDPQGVTYRNGRVPVGLLYLKTARQPEQVRRFVEYLLSPEGQAIWKASGYGPASQPTQ